MTKLAHRALCANAACRLPHKLNSAALSLLLLHAGRRRQVRNHGHRTLGIAVHRPCLFQRHHHRCSLDRFSCVRLMGWYHTPAIIFVGALRIGRLRNRLRQSLVANCSRSPKSFGSSNFTACPQLATFLAQATAEYRSSAREAAIRGDGRMPHCLVGASATGTPQICIQRAVDKAARRHGYLSMSALPPKGHVRCTSACPLSANSGHFQTYSINSSAVASSVGGIVTPSALAVLRLITSLYLVGACTGRSAGFSPLRMRSTLPAARRN